ncbi:hypothetical protein M8C21_023870, partial [Ambrosia artemisiifolia]
MNSYEEIKSLSWVLQEYKSSKFRSLIDLYEITYAYEAIKAQIMEKYIVLKVAGCTMDPLPPANLSVFNMIWNDTTYITEEDINMLVINIMHRFF